VSYLAAQLNTNLSAMFRGTATNTPATHCLDSPQNTNDREVVARARRWR